MVRLIGATIAGYIVYFALVFALMTLAWVSLGPRGAFQPEVWDVTGLWISLMLVASLLGGMVAGVAIIRIVPDPRVPLALAGVTVVMGIVFAWPALSGSAPVPTLPRPEQLPMFEAMAQGQAPIWVAVVNPVLGALGVLLGARSRRTA